MNSESKLVENFRTILRITTVLLMFFVSGTGRAALPVWTVRISTACANRTIVVRTTIVAWITQISPEIAGNAERT